MSVQDLRVVPESHISRIQNAYRGCRGLLQQKPGYRKEYFSAEFYNDQGSELFKQIVNEPTYYLPECELESLYNGVGTLSPWLKGQGEIDLVEFGCGAGPKNLVVPQFLQASELPFRYYPLDVCRESVLSTARMVCREMNMDVLGLVGRYEDGFGWLRSTASPNRKLVLFLGSTIGNGAPGSEVSFLGQLAQSLTSGDLILVGFDQIKDVATMEAAYACPRTAEFNRNLLVRWNGELQTNFKVHRFTQEARYNDTTNEVEMSLISQTRQVVGLAKQSYGIEEGERIIVESARKYCLAHIQEIASGCNLDFVEILTDTHGWFVHALLKVK